MPRLGLTEENKARSIWDEERFELKKDEVARIVLLEQEAEMELVHWIDGTGYVVCLGDYKTVMEMGGDSARCPACKAARPKSPVSLAKRKFVLWILRYRTNSRGEVLTPVTFDLMPWVFADDKFNTLVNKRKEWGDLRQHDLIVRCTSAEWQKYEIETAKTAVWLSSPELRAAGAKLYQERPKDIQLLLGRKLSYEDVVKAVANASGEEPKQAEVPASDVGEILAGSGAGSVDDLDALLTVGSGGDGEASPGGEQKGDDGKKGDKKETAPPAEEKRPSDDVDFDALLGLK